MTKIQVVGPGCANCDRLEAMCREIISENKIEATISKVVNINEFPDLGIFITPGLIINGVVKASGKIPTKHTLLRWIQDAA